MRIAIVGGGYVGLVTGACLAAHQHDVVIVESDIHKVKQINQGHCPIYEEGLPELLKEHIGIRLKATDKIADAVNVSEATFIAVGTPFDGQNIDLSQIEQAAQDIGEALTHTQSYHLVVVKSTVVPGTTDKTVANIIQSSSGKKLGVDFGLGMNPEFLKEGTAVEDFMKPDRIVIGGNDKAAQKKLEEIYACFPDADKVLVNNTTAEMIKYASNSLLATLISFSNELGNLCTELKGTDIKTVLEGVCLDKRISPILASGERVKPDLTSYLAAGCGFGGSCFPKDVNALRAFANQQGVETAVLDAVVTTNVKQPSQFIALLDDAMPELSNKTITVLGLAFKPGTDDTRESPAISVVQQLIERGAKVKVFDPVVTTLPNEIQLNNVSTCSTLADAVQHSEAVLITTAWEEFKALPQLLSQRESTVLVVDGRRVFKPSEFSEYRGIGLCPQETGPSNGSGKDSEDVSSAA
jgi:UDPglucose 6-dehydrogenase/GDP-mannose 6-dehydrogenase